MPGFTRGSYKAKAIMKRSGGLREERRCVAADRRDNGQNETHGGKWTENENLHSKLQKTLNEVISNNSLRREKPFLFSGYIL